jgi:hypothetical protein
MSALPCNLRISQEAYTALCEKAKAYGYIQGALTAKGVGRFLDALATSSFKDTRPEDVREAATGVKIRKSVQLTTQVSVAWLWSLEYSRLRYRISLDPQSIAIYVEIATQFQIAPYLSTLTRISAVFEAIGIGWLTPFTWPPVVDPHWHSPKNVTF